MSADRFGFPEQSQSPTFQPQSPTTPPRKSSAKSGQNRLKRPSQRKPAQQDYNNNLDDGGYSYENASNSYGINSNSNVNRSSSYGTNSNSFNGNTRPGSNGSNRSGSNEVHQNSGSQRSHKKQVMKKANGPKTGKGGFGSSNYNQFSAPGGLGTSGLNDPEAYQSSSNGNLVPCFKCGRKFASDRVEKHQNICSSVKQRKVFNSSKHRTEGTEAAAYNRPGRSSSKPQMPKSKSNWRKNHGKIVKNMVRLIRTFAVTIISSFNT